MSQVDDLLERNARFAESDHEVLPFLPRLKALVLTCADHRVDPARVLGLELGEAVVLRNGGGRVTPAALHNLAMLAAVRATEGGSPEGFELILMQHTDCGVGRLAGPEHADALAAYFGVSPEEVPAKSPADPYEGIRVDMEELAANQLIPASLSVSGLVYDVQTGRAELVERRSPLRETS
ncbi:MAG: carbonic anhydrase [Solirubrobacterales bacterium]